MSNYTRRAPKLTVVQLQLDGSSQAIPQIATRGFYRRSTDGASHIVAQGEFFGAAVYSLVADQASFTLTGQDNALTASRRLVAAQSSFTLSGQTAVLIRARKLIADQGSFALTGQANSFLYNRRITATQVAFALSGQSAAVLRNRLLTAAQSSFTFTGQAATLSRPARVIQVNFGQFNLEGQITNFRANGQLVAENGQFNLNGQAAFVGRRFTLVASYAAYAMTGTDGDLTESGYPPLLAGIDGEQVSFVYRDGRHYWDSAGELYMKPNPASASFLRI